MSEIRVKMTKDELEIHFPLVDAETLAAVLDVVLNLQKRLDDGGK